MSPDPLQASMNFVKILPKFDVLPRNMEDEKNHVKCTNQDAKLKYDI